MGWAKWLLYFLSSEIKGKSVSGLGLPLALLEKTDTHPEVKGRFLLMASWELGHCTWEETLKIEDAQLSVRQQALLVLGGLLFLLSSFIC